MQRLTRPAVWAAAGSKSQPSRRVLVSTPALALIVLGVSLLASARDAGAAPGDHLWSKRFGDASGQFGYSVAVDGAGNVFITGGFAGLVDFGGGPLTDAGDPGLSNPDIFLAKFDSAGNHLWSKRFGDAAEQFGYDVAVDSAGSVYFTGPFAGSVDFGGGPLTSAGSEDIFLAKFDPDGNHLWSKRFGDTDFDRSQSVAVDEKDSVIVTGQFEGSVDFGGGPLTSTGDDDVFLAKFDPDGSHLWSKRFGDAYRQVGYSVAADATGNVLLTGDFQGSVDFGGGPLTGAGTDDQNVYLAKFDPAGGHLWSKGFGDANSQVGLSVGADGAGNVLVTGFFYGSVDFGGGPLTSAGSDDYNVFLAKFDPAGSHLWSKGFGDADGQSGQSVAVDGTGNVVLTGAFAGSVDFGGGPLTSAGIIDIYLAKFSPAGNHLWSKRFGDAGYQSGNSVAVDGAGNLVLTGYFDGSVDFGGGPLTTADSFDIFLAKFAGAQPALGGVAELPAVRARAAAAASDRNDHNFYAYVTIAAVMIMMLAGMSAWRLRRH